MLHLHREPVSFHELVGAATAIAVVRPADPPVVLEEVSTGSYDGPGPKPPVVKYTIGYDRYVVVEWLRAPVGVPETIEVASPSNEASSRDAHDRARGMFGHVHHVVREFTLDGVPDAWRATPDAPRIVFLAPLAGDPASSRFSHAYGGLSLGLAARADILAAIVPPPTVGPPPLRTQVDARGAAVMVVILSLVAALLGLFLAGCRCGDPEPEPTPVLAHYARWDDLVDAAWKGDGERARELAIDLTGGPEIEVPDGPAADAVDTVSGALGFLSLAADREEMVDAIGVAGRGCGDCHEALAVIGPGRDCDHHSADRCIADQLVWPPLILGLGGFTDPVVEVLISEWHHPVDPEPPTTEVQARATRALRSCQPCHDRSGVR